LSVRVILQGGLGNQLFQVLKTLELAGDAERVVVDVTLLRATSRILTKASVTSRLFESESLAAELRWHVRRNTGVPPDAYRRVINAIAARAPSLRLGPTRLITGPFICTYQRSFADEVLGKCITRLYHLPAEPIDRQSVHLRLGDYQMLEHVYGPPSFRYYRDAMSEAFESGRPVAVFSDDVEAALAWLRDRFPKFDFRPADSFDWPVPPTKTSWQDLLRMAISSRLVAANSTYSWWAAWLGREWFGETPPFHIAPLRMHPTGLSAPAGVLGVSWRVHE